MYLVYGAFQRALYAVLCLLTVLYPFEPRTFSGSSWEYHVVADQGRCKMFVYKMLCHALRGDGVIVLCVASSGIAALLLIGGWTAHYVFKIPVEDLNDESICNILKESHCATLLRMTRLIIWDEMMMQHRNAPEAVNRTLRDICDNDAPFGGITVVFGGDYQQILPVVSMGSKEYIIAETLQRSYLWPLIEALKLTHNMRLDRHADEDVFAQWLLDIGHGRDLTRSGKVKLPANLVVDDVEALISSIYPDIHPTHLTPPPEYFLE